MTHLHISVHAITRGTLARTHELNKGKENRCLVFTISMKREIKKFSRRCRVVTAKKQKYLMTRTKLL